MVAYGLDRIDAEKDIKITLIEAAPRILPALPERLSEATTRLLRQLGVDVRTGARVTEVPTTACSWPTAASSRPSSWSGPRASRGRTSLADLDGLEASRTNQLVVTPTLQTTRDPDIFAIGDCAFLLPEGHDRPLPPRAQTAHQQATHVLGQIRGGWRASRSSPSSTATSARWSRSASTPPSAA